MASRNKKDLHPTLVKAYEKAVTLYLTEYPNDPQPFITCTYRSNAEQNLLFNQVPKVTKAKAGQSPHNYKPSLAFDIAFITVYKKLDWSIQLFKNFNDIIIKIEPLIVWGGNWKSIKDKPHFQLQNWKNYI